MLPRGECWMVLLDPILGNIEHQTHTFYSGNSILYYGGYRNTRKREIFWWLFVTKFYPGPKKKLFLKKNNNKRKMFKYLYYYTKFVYTHILKNIEVH